MMKSSTIITISAVLFAATAFPTLAIAGLPTPLNPVPGPIAGAGIPIIAIGYGAYRLIRRLRRKPE
jgi:hypothetical protein